MHRAALHGFTLIELLVVITIIVVLLALLTPALDKAIYQAELAVCGAQMKGISTATMNYAMENSRNYPTRADRPNVNAMALTTPRWGEPPQVFNVPRQLSPYLSADHFIDPLLDGGLEVDTAVNDPYSAFMPGYHYYPDWTTNTNDVTRMTKIGRSMTFKAPEGDVRQFGVMVADRDVRGIQQNFTNTSHPDKDGAQSMWVYQEGGNPWLSEGLGIGPVTGNVYVAQWQRLQGLDRGTVDNNFALDDGSVMRLNDVPIVDISAEEDPRITFVPDTPDINHYKNQNRKNQLPRVTN